ncbi:SPOSA6832_03176 [Sporobolomyces salmonicolor]|uniref:SPOSA6832_03176-mRNA-1:cds:26275 n=1 Tax=Sporidiobolus salmonicolor TaxID=5005 RepID=A0A0D6ENA1_SPOSA|nr:SPOSA6832_03176 [Sporobolomyces salmonicolor]
MREERTNLALEELERSTSTSRDVAELVLGVELGADSRRVAFQPRVALDPPAKFSNSKTPAGPFQRMVLALRMVSAKSLRDSGPQSRPMIPEGMPSLSVAAPTCGRKQSTGKTSSTPLAFAFSTSSCTFLAPASSKSESPISTFSSVFLKVKAIPPQTMSELTWSTGVSTARS